MAECLARFKSIPEMALLLKGRNRLSEVAPDARPFEGMEVALTLNGMVTSHMDPQADEDDLCYTENTPENFHKLLDALKRNEMPPTVDFTIGRYMDAGLQREWLASGNLLGNMTFDAKGITKGTPESFVEDIDRLDRALSPLMSDSPLARKYFRYPGLKTPQNESRGQIQSYLQKAGYVEVPATIYARDDKFNAVYCVALASNQESCLNLTKAYFDSLLLDTTLRARAEARNLSGSDSKQILMMSPNQFTCDNLDAIIRWYRRMGARFISLDVALRDPIYATLGEDGDPIAMSVFRTVKGQQE